MRRFQKWFVNPIFMWLLIFGEISKSLILKIIQADIDSKREESKIACWILTLGCSCDFRGRHHIFSGMYKVMVISLGGYGTSGMLSHLYQYGLQRAVICYRSVLLLAPPNNIHPIRFPLCRKFYIGVLYDRTITGLYEMCSIRRKIFHLCICQLTGTFLFRGLFVTRANVQEQQTSQLLLRRPHKSTFWKPLCHHSAAHPTFRGSSTGDIMNFVKKNKYWSSNLCT